MGCVGSCEFAISSGRRVRFETRPGGRSLWWGGVGGVMGETRAN